MAGIYLHIPFCKRRCIYCDFYSTTMEQRKDEYIEALCRELEMRRDYTGEPSVATVYFGGGTPSQLEERHFHRVFETIGNNYRLRPDAEITLEANPDDLTPDYVAMLRRLPFNRISIDLMYGLPGESRDSWANDLQQAIGLQVQHISAYHLIYEEGTELWELRRRHRVEEVDEDSSLTFFSMLIDRLRDAGFEHYEISNFALPGMHSRHNSSYWDGTRYLGCGAAAHSYNGESRQWNVASLDRYIKDIQAGKLPCEVETLDLHTRYNDRIITAIRTARGFSLSTLQAEFGKELHDFCMNNARPHLQQGTLAIIDGDRLHLTRQGIFVSEAME